MDLGGAKRWDREMVYHAAEQARRRSSHREMQVLDVASTNSIPGYLRAQARSAWRYVEPRYIAARSSSAVNAPEPQRDRNPGAGESPLSVTNARPDVHLLRREDIVAS